MEKIIKNINNFYEKIYNFINILLNNVKNIFPNNILKFTFINIFILSLCFTFIHKYLEQTLPTLYKSIENDFNINLKILHYLNTCYKLSFSSCNFFFAIYYDFAFKKIHNDVTYYVNKDVEVLKNTENTYKDNKTIIIENDKGNYLFDNVGKYKNEKFNILDTMNKTTDEINIKQETIYDLEQNDINNELNHEIILSEYQYTLKILIISSIICLIVIIGIVFSFHFIHLLFFLFIMGINNSNIYILIQKLYTNNVYKENRSTIYGLHHFFSSFSHILSISINTNISNKIVFNIKGWRICYIIFFFTPLIVCIFLFKLIKECKFTRFETRKKKVKYHYLFDNYTENEMRYENYDLEKFGKLENNDEINNRNVNTNYFSNNKKDNIINNINIENNTLNMNQTKNQLQNNLYEYNETNKIDMDNISYTSTYIYDTANLNNTITNQDINNQKNIPMDSMNYRKDNVYNIKTKMNNDQQVDLKKKEKEHLVSKCDDKLKYKFSYIYEIKYVFNKLSFWLLLGMGMLNGIPRHVLTLMIYFFQYCNISNFRSGLIISVSWFCASLVSPFIGVISDYIYRLNKDINRQILGMITHIFRIILMFILFFFIPKESESFTYFVIISILMGISSGWLNIGIQKPIIIDIVKQKHTALILALMNAFENIGSSIIGTFLLSKLLNHYNYIDNKNINYFTSDMNKHNANVLSNVLLILTCLPWILSFLFLYILKYTYRKDKSYHNFN